MGRAELPTDTPGQISMGLLLQLLAVAGLPGLRPAGLQSLPLAPSPLCLSVFRLVCVPHKELVTGLRTPTIQEDLHLKTFSYYICKDPFSK